ncbi:hypothetical protein B0J14DRAFT_465524, partial [Halenospora varia]
MRTDSPQDLLMRDVFASTPNTSAFAHLISPSTYDESPEYNDNYEDSPFVGNDPWYPLFPQNDQTEQPAKVEQSPLLPEEEHKHNGMLSED